jgi:hypothetical protein
MNDQVIRRTTPTRRWKSWCGGELQDLRRLISLMEQLAIQRKSEVMSSSVGDYELSQWNRKQVLLGTFNSAPVSDSGVTGRIGPWAGIKSASNAQPQPAGPPPCPTGPIFAPLKGLCAPS